MKAVILAAGVGSRLAPFDDAPKTLTQLDNGKSLLQMQLDALLEHLAIEDISAVVGYKFELIEAAFPKLPTVKNLYFRTENTAKSLLKALERLGGPDEDLLWLNGDVVFDRAILSSFLENKKSSTVVIPGEADEEAVKYSTDGNGHLLELSKTVAQPEGESVGIQYFEKEHVPFLIRGLKQCGDQDYFERGVEYALTWGVQVTPFPVEPHQCLEIDFIEDLNRANQLF